MFREDFAFVAVRKTGCFVRRDAGRQALRHRLRKPPIRLGITGRRHGGMHAADAAFGIGDRARFLGPGGGGQHQVGVGQRLGAGVGLLHDHELGLLQGRAHASLVGQRLRRVRCRNPQHFHAACQHGVEKLQRGGAGRIGQAVHAPQRRDLGAVLGHGRVAVARQQGRHSAGFAPAHGIRLAGQRKRPRARFADLPGGQMQMDQRGVLVGALGGLVQAHRVERQRRAAASEPARGLDDVGGRHAADFLRHGRGVRIHRIHQHVKAVGVAVDVRLVDPPFARHDVQHGMKERHVRARRDGQVQVGERGGIRAAGVHHDHLHAGPARAGRFQAAKQHGVGVRHV
ncbi:hypothetical protein D3C72_1312660 [compost metagenome]